MIFAAILLFFDQYDIFSQIGNYKKLRKLDKQIEEYDKHISEDKQTLDRLKNDTALLEKIAREQYMMKRDNEVIYIMADDEKK